MSELPYTNQSIKDEHDSALPETKKVSLYGWDSTNMQKTRLAVDSNGAVKLDPTNLDSRYVNHGADGEGTEDLNYVAFNTAYTPNGEAVGSMYWNSADGTLDVKLNTDVNLQLGQEIHFYGKASGDIANGALVQFAGVQGDHILMKECVVAEIQANPTHFIGVATQSITNGSFGYVTWFGYVNDVYTDTPDNGDSVDWSVGDILYFDNTTGQLTNTAPTVPDTKIEVAAVVKTQTGASQTGRLLVRPTLYHKLEEASDVDVSGIANGNVLIWDSTNNKWVASAGTTSWGSITGTLSNQTDLQTELDTKADTTNVLELDNTTPFTPDQDYEPATKKYVDDNATSSPLTTKGDLYTYDTDNQRLAVGTNNQLLSADSTEPTGLKWIDAPASSPLTTKGDIYTYGTDNARLPVGTDGQYLKADSTQSTGLNWDTLTASDVTDFDTEVSNNTDVSANTSARHNAVTVTDSSEIDFTLTGQDITASIVAGSIDETKLDTSVNASLDLADGSVQINDIIKQSYTPTWANVTVGNGTSVGNYVVIGDFVSGEAVLTFGSTTAITGNVYVTLPITPTDTPVLPLGVITIRDTGVRQAGGILHTQTNNDQGLLRIFETLLGYARQVSVNATRPFALSTGDNILVNFYYRIGGTGAGGGVIDP